MTNRLGVFVFYEKDGTVRNYVRHILSEIRMHVSELAIICNGEISEEGKKALKEYSTELYVRDNIGFDAGALKYYFCNKFDKNRLKELDEILIFNHTFYGPFGGFSGVFSEMKKRKCDFWGLTDYKANDRYPYHIQSYFVCFRSNVIRSNSFAEFWDTLQGSFADIRECIDQYEVRMTAFFHDKGFKSDSFVKSEIDRNIYFMHPYELLIHNKYPLLKRKCFVLETYDDIIYNYEFAAALSYLQQYYNKEYLYMCEDVIRSFDITVIKKSADLSIIPMKCRNLSEKFFVRSNNPRLQVFSIDDIKSKQTADDSCCLLYYTEKYNLSEHEEIVLFDNAFKDQEYASSICEIFRERKEIGCLLPEMIVSDLRLKDFFSAYVSYGVFWIRNNLLESIIESGVTVSKLVNMEGEELARLIQSHGYFTYVIKNRDYDRAENAKKSFILKELLIHLSNNYEFTSLSDVITKLHGDRLHTKRIKTIINNRIKKSVDL